MTTSNSKTMEDILQSLEEIADFGSLDLSHKKLIKLKEEYFVNNSIKHLKVDYNSLKRLENLNNLKCLETLSAKHNKISKTSGLMHLKTLTYLDLSNNEICVVEYFKELVNLQWLSLANNSIKEVRGLETNIELEYIDLSGNSISSVPNLSSLSKLKELKLHYNYITDLKECEKRLPVGIKILNLSGNVVKDLNQICYLSHLNSLNELSLVDNPCIAPIGLELTFDYRPFVINWCLSLQILNGIPINVKESLKAEWLYSQGKGRTFRPGDQNELVEYLSNICPINSETKEESKLSLILSKAQQHQRQLWLETEQDASGGEEKKVNLNESGASVNANTSANTSSLKRPSSRPTTSESRRSLSSCDSPSAYSIELPATLYNHKVIHQDFMTISADAASLKKVVPDLAAETIMSKSLDSELIDRPKNLCGDLGVNSNPLKAASKLVPVPETIMSPDYRPATSRHMTTNPDISKLQKGLVLPGRADTKSLGNSSNSSSGSGLSSNRDNKKATNNKISELSKSPIRSRTSSTSPRRLPPAMTRSLSVEPVRKIQYNHKKSSTPPQPRRRNVKVDDQSSDDSDMSESKLEIIKSLASERQLKTTIEKPKPKQHINSLDENTAAKIVQRAWRVHRSKYDELVHKIDNMRTKRLQDHDVRIRSLQSNIENLNTAIKANKIELEFEKHFRSLEAKAIFLLRQEIEELKKCKKVDTSNNEDMELMTPVATITNKCNKLGLAVRMLADTCNNLQSQINVIQESYEGIMHSIKELAVKDEAGASSLTEAISVPRLHVDKVPEVKSKVSCTQMQNGLLTLPKRNVNKSRPSYLPIVNKIHSVLQDDDDDDDESTIPEHLESFASSLVSDLLKDFIKN